MGLAVSFEMDRNRGKGIQGFVKRLDGFKARGMDATPALMAIHKQFLATERGIFSSDGPSGAHWQPLTARYLRWKVSKKGWDPRIERATGALYRALTTGAGEGAVTEIDRTGATFGTTFARAAYAQRGIGRRRRRLVVINRRRRSRWVATLRDWLVDGRKTGG